MITAVADGKKAWTEVVQWLTILVLPQLTIKPKKRAWMEVTPQEPPKQQQLLAKYNPRWAVEASRQAELVPKPRREEPARPTKPIQIKLRRKDRE